MNRIYDVDFKYNETVNIEIELCKRNYNRTKINYVSGAKNKSITPRFGAVGEISFDVDKFIKSGSEMKLNPVYEQLDGDMVLKVTMLKKVDYFVITSCDEDCETQPVKHITAYSYQYTFKDKMIRKFEGVKKLYDITNPKDSVLHEVIRLNPSWSVGYVNHDINKFRLFKVDEQDLMTFLHDLQKTLKCIVLFDNVNRTISIEKLDNIGLNRGLVFNERNYTKHIKIQPNFEDIVTRLYVYGKDDLGINRLTTTGASYIENFDYYLLNNNLVDDDLVIAIRRYQKLLIDKKGEFDSLLDGKNIKLKDMTELNNQVIKLQSELKIIQDEIDVAIKSGQGDLNVLYNKEKTKKGEILAKEVLVKNKQKEIDVFDDRIEILRVTVSAESNFTKEQFFSMSELVKESTYRDNNIFDDVQLLEEGEKYLEDISQPMVNFSISSVNFLKCLDQQVNWDKVILGLGDIVNIENEKIDKYFKVRLIEYTYNEDSTDFNLSFSNKDSLDNAGILFGELESKVNSTSTTVDINKFKYGEYNNDKNEIMDYINGELDLARQAAVGGHNNDFRLDERGLTLINKDNQNFQTKILNNLIVFTEDGWRTCKTSISNGKVIADNIIGKLLMGNELIIGDSEGTFNILGNKQVIKNRKGEVKVILGEYDYNKFGLKIFSSSGNVILDEDGLLQTWQEGRADNVDNGYPLRLWVYVPEKTKSIVNATLRFKLEKFRAYSKSASAGGGTSSSTMGGGGTGNIELTSRGTSETSGANEFSRYGEVHDHGIPEGSRLMLYQGYTTLEDGTMVATCEDYPRYEAWIPSGEHSHTIEIPSHSHRFDIPDHDHEFKVPLHEHRIDYGIYEGDKPRNIRIVINGGYVGNIYNSDQFNINIKDKLNIGSWNEIQISTERLGRIDASVFIQAFMMG